MGPSRTLSWTIGAGLVAFVALGASGQGQVASEEEALEVAESRSQTMKAMGKSMRTLKGFAGGRGTAEDASAAAAVIADAAPTLPSLFPAGSGMAALPDSESKDVIWEEWNDFVAATERLGEKAAALKAAIAGGDSGAIGAAFGDLGKNGCGGCHSKFREKRDS
ncbi:MAG: cytochrome c [Immundisolibacterales bacterium]|nr:cytochrome c [Immundisolibacterales bacterium]